MTCNINITWSLVLHINIYIHWDTELMLLVNEVHSLNHYINHIIIISC